jgi:hypothetical protein
MKHENESIVVTRDTGKVVSGGDDHNHGCEIFQPDADTAIGAASVRKRTEDASVNHGGHKVTNDGVADKQSHDTPHRAKHAADSSHADSPAETPESKSRAEYVKSERERKDEKTASATRVPLKELVANSKGV